MPNASPWYASIAGHRVSTAPPAAAVPWSETALMRPRLTGSGIGARHARDASTTSLARCWQAMTEQLRRGLVAKIAPVRLEGEVEIDEVYIVAGHKGQPAAVAKGGGSDAAAGWRERRDAARWRRTSRRSSA